MTMHELSKFEQELKGEPRIPIEEINRFLTIEDIPDGWLKDYVSFAYPLTEAPLQYHIATGLAIAATALGRNVHLEEGANTFYPNLYIVVIGESGITRKSTAINLSFKFLNKLEPSLVLGSTMSTEALLESFQKTYCHCLIYDELRMITDNEDKSYGKGLITLLTSLWSCPDTWRVELKSIREEKRTLNSPTPNILCATTPDWIQLKEADVLGGFLGRFLPIYTDGKGRRLLPRRAPMDALKFEGLLIRLKEMRNKGNVIYEWNEEAGKIFDGLYGDWDKNFKKEKNMAQLQPYWSRVDTHIRKLAMIFDICSEKPTYTITKDNLLRANLFMEVITEYYRQMLGKLTYSRDDKKEQQITDLIKKAHPKGVKHADIMRNLHLKAKEMESLMNTLQEKEIIELKEEQLTRKKGKVYYLIG